MDRNFQRLLDLLVLVPRQGKLSTPQLHQRLVARGHDISVRTVQRDLEDLATVYPILCDDRSKPFGWSWDPHASRLSLPAMDWSEAVCFQLLSTYLQGVLPSSVLETLQPYIQEAHSKLAQQFPDVPLKKWPERVRITPPGPTFYVPKVSSAVHAAVTEAVLLGRQIAVHYLAFERKQAKRYVVSPLGLVQFGSVFYVPARFDGHDDVRTLRLHRMSKVELLDPSSGIDQFDLDEWIEAGGMGFGGQEQIELVLRLFDGLGERMREAPLGRDQQLVEESPGVHLLTVTLLQTVQLERWLLGLAPNAVVVAPKALREQMRSHASTLLRRIDLA